MIDLVKLSFQIFIIFLLLSPHNMIAPPDKKHAGNHHTVYLPGKDSVFINPVDLDTLIQDNYFYYCLLNTPVCNDTLCQLVRLNIQWDLIGNYIRFDTLSGYPLTKYDHLPFTSADYERLHHTLRDKNSVLGRTSEYELLDKTKTRYSEKIDGVTGATSTQIKNSVVEGAMYSTYALWHLINGPIGQELKKYTIKNYDQEIERQLIFSGQPQKIITALQQWNERNYINRFGEIISIMSSGNALVNFYIAKSLPEEVLSNSENQNSLKKIWNELDPNTKSILSDYVILDH